MSKIIKSLMSKFQMWKTLLLPHERVSHVLSHTHMKNTCVLHIHMCHINTYTGTHACMTIHMYYTHSSIDYLLNHIHTSTCRCSAWMHKISSLARMHKYHMHACAHIMIYIYVCACMHDVYLHMWHIHEWSWSVVHTCKCTICMHAQALHTIIMHAAQMSVCNVYDCDALDAWICIHACLCMHVM